MKPIVVTTPRTGSKLFCHMMTSVATQHYGYKGSLGELFTIVPFFRTRYQYANNVISAKFTQRIDTQAARGYSHKTDGKWFTSVRDEQLKRLSWISDEDAVYLIKIFPIDIEPEIEEEITTKYDIIYLERRDRLRQLISYFGMHQSRTKESHYYVKQLANNKNFLEINTIEELRYNKKITTAFLRSAMIYQEFKQTYPSKYPTVYYEDFIAEGANEQAIVKLLGLAIDVQINDSRIVPTPYKSSNPEDLIVNQSIWLENKPDIIRKLNNIYGTTY